LIRSILVPGEDPYLTSQYASAFVQGLQGTEEKIQVAAACKHFVANSLEQWGAISRHNFDAHISPEDLYTYYFPPFRECTKHAMGAMCSYNALNGMPSCANTWLLRQVLRQDWQFDGYVVSDCGALDDIVTGHHSAVDATQASAMALNASVDVNCGNGDYYPNGLLQAYQEGWVEEATIRESFSRLAKVQFRLGLFDPKEYHPDDDVGVIGSHDDLALEAALQSIVLLQNRNGLLPLDPNQKLAVIGPHIHATEALLSSYHGAKCGCGKASESWDCIETPLQALEKVSNYPIKAVTGCHVAGADLNEIDQATQAAEESDVVILLVGLDHTQEREGLDRNETTLPGLQPQLIKSILEVASNKTVLILIHGGSMSLGDYILEHTPAILSAPYGGQAASHALASVLLGEYNPSGKLAVTMYPPSFVQELPLTEMGLQVGVGRTHMYYQGTPEFPFGHGLSYSRWQLDWADQWDLELYDTGPALHVNVTVQNVGPHSGSQTVLLYWRPKFSINIRQKLIGVQGTQLLDVGQKDVLLFDIKRSDFAMWDGKKNAMAASPGTYQLEARASNALVTRTLRVTTAGADDLSTNMQ
jgi:beta-glucosidase-like glycosyl hydrolase